MNNVYINIANLFYKYGIYNVCISPGLRNTALSLSFIKHGKFNCYSIIDERSAGFFALGIAMTLYNVGSEIVWLGDRGSVPEDLAKDFSYSLIDFERINSIYLGISVFFVAIYSAIIWWLIRPTVVREFKV